METDINEKKLTEEQWEFLESLAPVNTVGHGNYKLYNTNSYKVMVKWQSATVLGVHAFNYNNECVGGECYRKVRVDDWTVSSLMQNVIKELRVAAKMSKDILKKDLSDTTVYNVYKYQL